MNRFAVWWQRWRHGLHQRMEQFRAPGKFLCDSCRYDYGKSCRRPERPNVAKCPEYRRR
jgi:hypothetical protein